MIKRVHFGQPRRAAADARIDEELSTYRSESDLLDMAAALRRFADADTEPVRARLAWPTAA